MRHAELNERVASLRAIGACARGVDHDANIGDGAFGLPRLSTRPAALLVHVDEVRAP